MSYPITVVGLGPGDPSLLTLAAEAALESDAPLFLRTARHPTVSKLDESGRAYDSFDAFYDEESNFDILYARIVETLVSRSQTTAVTYAVPGHPLVAESTVTRLLQHPAAHVKIVPGLSGVEATYALLGVDPTNGLQLLDALALEGVRINPALGALVVQVYNKRVAGAAKLLLMKFFPDEHPVKLIQAASVPGAEKILEVPLYAIDRHPELIDHLTSLYLPPAPAIGVDRLRDIVARLRAPNGCPWDREQTHASLRKFMLEEAYEAVEAIDDEDEHGLCEELGDVLLQIALHARIAEEREAFDLDEVAEGICDKLIYRHPHVFGDVQVSDVDEVLSHWEVLKQREKEAAGELPSSRLGKISPNAALAYADKVLGRAAKARFEWPHLNDALAKVNEEWLELQSAIRADSASEAFTEFGDHLYALVNVARMLGVDAEDALRQATRRFISRFEAMEELAATRNLAWDSLDIATFKAMWNEAKQVTRC